MSYFVRCGVFSGFPQLLAQYGVDYLPLLRNLNLAENLFDDDENLIEIEAGQQLLEQAAKLSNCPHFGLKLGHSQNMAFLGTLGLIMRSAPDLITAFERNHQFHHIHAQGINWTLECEGEFAYLRLSSEHGYRKDSVQAFGMALAQANNMLRLLNKNCRPLEVHFHFEEPSDPLFYRQVFASQIFFDSHFDGIVLRVADLYTPLQTQDDLLHATLTKYASQLSQHDINDFVLQIRRAIRQLLPTASCTIEDVALVFNCDKRTLQRRLKANKHNYSDIRDQERFNIACKHLKNSSAPMVIIAELAGFSDISTFSRAFKSYVGLPPSKWRQQEHQTCRKEQC